MGCVPDQEHVAALPRRRLPVREGVSHGALDLEVSRVDVGLDQPTYELGLLDVRRPFVLAQLELQPILIEGASALEDGALRLTDECRSAQLDMRVLNDTRYGQPGAHRGLPQHLDTE